MYPGVRDGERERDGVGSWESSGSDFLDLGGSKEVVGAGHVDFQSAKWWGMRNKYKGVVLFQGLASGERKT